MARSAQIILVRHGESTYNKEHRFAGQTDVPLTDKGVQDARDAGVLYDEHGLIFDRVFSSDLQRAYDTAIYSLETSAFNGHLIPSIIKDERLRERDFGAMSGKPWNKVENETSAQRSARFATEFAEHAPDAEDVSDVTVRVKDFIDDVLVGHLKRNETILIACHGGVIRAFHVALKQVTQENMYDVKVANGEIFSFDETLLKEIGLLA